MTNFYFLNTDHKKYLRDIFLYAVSFYENLYFIVIFGKLYIEK